MTVAFDYGSRTEITQAARRLAAAQHQPNIQSMAEQMYLPDLPDVDGEAFQPPYAGARDRGRQ